MDETSAGIESELPDLSTENVATLRTVALSGLTPAIERVRERITDADGNVSGYNPSFTNRSAGAGSEAEDPGA